MMPVSIRGAEKEYLDMFGRGEETRKICAIPDTSWKVTVINDSPCVRRIIL